MKFTQKEAYEELVKQMTTNGEALNLSQRSINAQLEKLIGLVANDETELSDFVSSVLPFIKTADANVRNDVSQGIKDYKEKNPAPTPPKEPDGDDAVVKGLMERLQALEQKNIESERVLKCQKIKHDINEKLKELGVKNEKWLSLMLGNLSVSDETNVETEANTLLELFNSMQADVEPNATPKGAGGKQTDYNLGTIKEAASLVSGNNV